MNPRRHLLSLGLALACAALVPLPATAAPVDDAVTALQRDW